MSHPTYSADQVARYFLSITDPEDNDVSNLKLQKLCYYAQGLLTSMRGTELFGEPICAWDHGPVVVDLYHRYKVHGSQPIPSVTDFDAAAFVDADRRALSDIYTYYGQYSPWRLRNMTHEDRPWKDAYNACPGSLISVGDLVAYFAPQVEDDYVRKVYGEQGGVL